MNMGVNKPLYYFAITCILWAVSTPTTAQNKSRKEYEKERKALQQKIELGRKVLAEIESEREVSLGELRAIKEQIANQNSLLNTLRNEIRVLKADSAEQNDIIIALKSDLDRLKEEYSRMIYQSYKVSNNYNDLTYLFSSKSLDELAMRLEYLNQFNRARKVQVEKITQVMGSLKDQDVRLQKVLQDKKKLIYSLQKQKNDLRNLRSRQDAVIEKLSSRQAEQRTEISSWQQRQKELDKIIKKLIAEEIKKQNSKTNVTLQERRGLELLSKNFEANKGRLPWPLERCSITRKFGQHKDPLLGIMENNLGIGLMGQKGAQVKAVFEGTVSIVTKIRGQNQMIMVKHGTYFTVYINLNSVSVKPGDVVTTGQILGTVHTNHQNLTELEFHVWKGAGAQSEKLNPEHWLHK